MVATQRPAVQSLLESLSKGRALPAEPAAALSRLLGVEPKLKRLSRLFQPGFPGIRTFVVDVHAEPDQAVAFTLVGVSRSGRPVWTGTRAFAFGRDGSLEIHRGFDEIAQEYRSRNITVDLMQREMDLLALLQRGPNPRLTIDAEGVGRYICALHGFLFADDTDEGPPVRSVRALEPSGDREALAEAARFFTRSFAERKKVGRIAVEEALSQIDFAENPWDFARLSFPGVHDALADTDEGEMGVTELGREFLLSKHAPAWRAAAYVTRPLPRSAELGTDYRKRKTAASERRLANELQEAREGLSARQRTVRLKALDTLGMLAPSWIASEIRPLTEGADRRVAAAARAALRQISGSDLAERMLKFAGDTKNRAYLRALAYRVLAEHFPAKLAPEAAMLRVNPDARIQRAVVPLITKGPDQAEDVASMLAANPWESTSEARPGLLNLRLELINHVRIRADPSTLPCLMEAFRHHPSPPPAEQLALSRALVAFADPRAQTVLSEAARRLGRPAVP